MNSIKKTVRTLIGKPVKHNGEIVGKVVNAGYDEELHTMKADGYLDEPEKVLSAIRNRKIQDDIYVPFGNTICMMPGELGSFNRTIIDREWICEYCKAVNPHRRVHCAHCGAPHTAG